MPNLQQQPQQLKATIEITPTGRKIFGGDEVNINAVFHTFRTIDEGSDMVSCYIPAFDIYYGAPSMEEGLRRAPIMAKTFLIFWANKQGFKKFISHIIKLGFRADAITNTKLAHGKPIDRKTDLSFPTIGILPPQFRNAVGIKQEVENLEAVQ